MGIRLGTDGDIELTADKRMTFTTGGDSVQQHMQIRFKFFLGEWFLDERIGVAWLQTIFKKGTPLELIRSILRRTATQTPGVRSVSKFETVFDGATRELTVELEGLLEPGVVPEVTGAAPFRFAFSEFILQDQQQPENTGIT